MTDADKKALLKIARDAVTTELSGKKYDVADPGSIHLRAKSGAFVTIHGAGGELRGCIGLMQANIPLYETVSEMALEAAFGDPRFDRVRSEELPDLKFEISVLSPFRKIKDPKEIKLGKHGVMVKQGFNSGVFLPRVAAETGWSLEEFMNHLCAGKAGIDPESWKNGTAEIYVFEADIISE